MKIRLDPLLEETLAAIVAMSLVGAIIALLFWWFTGFSPWPFLVLGEVAGAGFGVILLVLASPRRHR